MNFEVKPFDSLPLVPIMPYTYYALLILCPTHIVPNHIILYSYFDIFQTSPCLILYGSLNDCCIYSFFCLFYIEPSCFKTDATVLNNIRISSPILHSAMYLVSNFTTSSKSVISLRPLTCHNPVIPGLIANLAR